MAYFDVHISRHLEEKLAWAIDKQLQVICYLKRLCHYKTKKYIAISSFNNIVCITVLSLVMYSNCLVIYYRLVLHGSTIKIFLCSVLFKLFIHDTNKYCQFLVK